MIWLKSSESSFICIVFSAFYHLIDIRWKSIQSKNIETTKIRSSTFFCLPRKKYRWMLWVFSLVFILVRCNRNTLSNEAIPFVLRNLDLQRTKKREENYRRFVDKSCGSTLRTKMVEYALAESISHFSSFFSPSVNDRFSIDRSRFYQMQWAIHLYFNVIGHRQNSWTFDEREQKEIVEKEKRIDEIK